MTNGNECCIVLMGVLIIHLQSSHPVTIAQHTMHCTSQDMHAHGDTATSDTAALSQNGLADAMCSRHHDDLTVKVKCNIMPCVSRLLNNGSVRQLSAAC